MKFEKRASFEPSETVSPAAGEPAGSKKSPVIVYILVLFLAAFLLMLLSLLAHQRSTTRELGRLQSSVSAMQEIQEQIIDLQQQLDEAEKSLSSSETALQETQDALASSQKECQALQALYTLQQEYLTGNLDGCRLTLQEMSDQGLVELLPDSGTAGVTTPAQRYQELKLAILNP